MPDLDPPFDDISSKGGGAVPDAPAEDTVEKNIQGAEAPVAPPSQSPGEENQTKDVQPSPDATSTVDPIPKEVVFQDLVSHERSRPYLPNLQHVLRMSSAIVGHLIEHAPDNAFLRRIPIGAIGRANLTLSLLEALIETILPKPAGERGAPPLALPYSFLRHWVPKGSQAHHLNQDAAYGDVIPYDEGLSISLLGDAIQQPGTPHYVVHQSLEEFWKPYRQPGPNSRPTNAEYGEAHRLSLIKAGVPEEIANNVSLQAAAQRACTG
jgi:hypothetical protein